MANIPSTIIKLVERFERNIEAYRSQQYNETQLRREFIDPFFEQLGWDVTNKAGYAEAYKDVIHEDTIKIGGATKAPDYCFRIGGVRKFFLEAKKPSIDIKGDPHPAYQLRRYAWSAKLPLSLLTDFEEFAVYDCQRRPKQIDSASTARIMFFTYKDYLDKWDRIAEIFSKDAVLKGSFDRFVTTTKGKRGTTTVDKEFLAEIEKWREMLAKIIALRNRSLSIHDINFSIQQTIDRILFLRLCEDRGIEDYGQLLKISSGDRTYPRLCEVFEKADQKYNSGLFHFSDEPGRPEPPDELTLKLTIDDKDLKWILHSLYYPQSPYEFSVLPAEILGNVYEQFLGKVIRLTSAHRAVVEEKPEVKKAGGVYYTPAYIVDYIVKNTVGKLCEGKTPKQISKLKILDPACGSGSFLLGAYTYLLDYHRDWYTNNEPEKWMKKKKPPIYQATSTRRHCEERSDEAISNYRLTVSEKKRILLNNIFGVDIDSQAVEVTKLSLLLKVLEGENWQTLENQYRLFHERALPDLGNNIKCGNSLIAPDFYDNIDPNFITEEIRQKINAFDWQAEFPEIFNHKNPGFDAIIGNPPYVRIQTMKQTQPEAIPYFSTHYKSASVGNYDIYVVFVDRGFSLLNSIGRLGYIVPHRFFKADYGKGLRSLLVSNKSLDQIFDFDSFMVFSQASINTAILILTKQKSDTFLFGQIHSYKILEEDIAPLLGKLESKPFFTETIIVDQIRISDFSQNPWVFVWPAERTLWDKLERIQIRLRNVTSRIFQGIKTSADLVYTVNLIEEKDDLCIIQCPLNDSIYEIEASFLKALIKGGQMHRYHIGLTNKRLIFPYDNGKLISRDILIEQTPKTWQYLLDHKSYLENRERGKMKGSNWYAYGRSQALTTMGFSKIITPDYYAHASYCIDRQGIYYFCGGGAGGYGIVLKTEFNPLYVLGLLNSKLLDWYLHKITMRAYQTAYMYVKKYIEHLPIRTIDFDNPDDRVKHDKMIKFVDRMLDLHMQLAAAKIPDEKTRIQRQINATDKQIDKLVYDLYDLTEEEISIVERDNAT